MKIVGRGRSSARHPEQWDNDAKLARAAARGDNDAQRKLCQCALPVARHTARHLMGRDQDVEDAIQATLLEVLRSVPRFRGQSSLATWVARIATRTTLRLAKKRSDLVPTEALESLPAPSRTDSRADELPRPVTEYLARLPDPQRVALVLRYGQDHTVDDIAEATGCSRNTVKYRLKKALATIQRLVRQDLAILGTRNDG
jgi:RNA polymerase sigma-70 factor (ECF subfamily)